MLNCLLGVRHIKPAPCCLNPLQPPPPPTPPYPHTRCRFRENRHNVSDIVAGWFMVRGAVGWLASSLYTAVLPPPPPSLCLGVWVLPCLEFPRLAPLQTAKLGHHACFLQGFIIASLYAMRAIYVYGAIRHAWFSRAAPARPWRSAADSAIWLLFAPHYCPPPPPTTTTTTPPPTHPTPCCLHIWRGAGVRL